MPSSQLSLSDEDRATLEYWTRCSTIRAGHAERARVVLAIADGAGTSATARLVGVSRPTVIKWRDRFLAHGLAGLDDQARSGRPKTIDDAQIIAATLEAPPESLAVTHWSSRLLGRQLGISDATVARAWRAYRVQPWRQGTFKFSTDPALEGKVRDVVGLHLDPPRNAIVLCVDESPRSRRSIAPSRSCRCDPACRRRPPTTTNATAPPRSLPRLRSRPARSPTVAMTATARLSFWTSSDTSPAPTHAAGCTSCSTTTTPTSTTTSTDGRRATRGSRCTSP